MHHYTKNNENVFFVAVLTSTFFNKIIWSLSWKSTASTPDCIKQQEF